MGLRLRLSLALLLTFALLGLVATGLLQLQVRRDYQRIELEAATQAMTRLLRVLEAHFVSLDRSTAEWSNYDDMYAAMQRKDRRFLDDLTVAHLNASALSVLALRDTNNNFVRIIEAPHMDGDFPITALVTDKRPVILDFLQTFPLTAQPKCGLTPLSGAMTLLMLCDHPVVRSDGSGTPAGRVTIGRWLNETTLRALQAETQLEFHFRLIDAHITTPGLQAGTPPAAVSFLGRMEQPTLLFDEERFEISLPLQGVIDAKPAGHLTLVYPRTLLARANAEMWRSTLFVTLMVLLTCLIMLLLIDRIVVARLKRLQREVGQATQHATWTTRISRAGADEIGTLAADVNVLLDVIKGQVTQLQALSRTDTLTGIANRRAFDERLAVAISLHVRQRTPVSLVLIDVDFFKKYNDHYGHPAGDAALQNVASALTRTITRATDLAARVGGEEFALLLEDTDAAGAAHCADRLRTLLRDAALPHELNPAGRITVSAGIAQLQTGDDAASLYARADAGLYQAKQAGRDRAVIADVTPALQP